MVLGKGVSVLVSDFFGQMLDDFLYSLYRWNIDGFIKSTTISID